MEDKKILLDNIDKIHTTEMGIDRIKRNLKIDTADVVEFGNRKHDKALVAEMQGNVIGAIWVRIMNDYGHIDNDTPSLAMSVYKKYRGLGIGTSLLKQLLQVERLAGYSKISLSVQKSNYAVKMYEKVGFTVADENNEEYIMIVNL